MRRAAAIIRLLAMTLALAAPAMPAQAQTPAGAPATAPAGNAVETVMPLKGVGHRVQIEPAPEGGHRVRLKEPGREQNLTPDEFVAQIYREQQDFAHRHWLLRFLNISTWGSLTWIAVGILGQMMFTFRMVLQWLASEKEKRSVVPVGFWWGSLIGGAMLLLYFIWRKDVVGVLGQSTGVLIYARNLILIYRRPRVDKPAAAPANA